MPPTCSSYTEAEGAPSRQELADQLALLQERKGRYDELLGELKATGQNEVSSPIPTAGR